MAVHLKLAAKKLLAIDWDARDLRVVLFRPRAEGIDLIKAVSIPIQPGLTMAEPEAFGAFLRAAIGQARMNVKRALLTIPRDRVVLNNLRLPPTPVDELPSMINLQVGKELPFAAEQATIDFVVQNVGAGPVDALVAAVRNEDLDVYRKVAYEAGLTVEGVGLRPHGNVVAVSAGSAAGGTTLIVEVGPALTEIDIVRDGVLAFSRAASATVGQAAGAANGEPIDDSRIISLPVQDRVPDEMTSRAVGAVLLEVVRSYEAHRATEPGVKISRIVVAGSTGIETELAQALSGRFAVRAELYSAEGALGLSAQRARELRGFSAVLGLAMSLGQRGQVHFDFLHPKRTVSKRQRQIKKAPVAAAVVAMFAASTAYAYWKVVTPKIKQAKATLAQLDVQKKKYDALLEFQKKIQAVEDWRGDEQYWVEVLIRLTRAFPPDDEVFATRLAITTRTVPKTNERTQSMTVSLRTASSRAVNQLAEKMKEAGFLDVLPGRTSETTPNGGYRYDASITATIPRRVRPAEDATDEPTSQPASDLLDAEEPEGPPTPTSQATTTAPAAPAAPTTSVSPTTPTVTSAPASAPAAELKDNAKTPPPAAPTSAPAASDHAAASTQPAASAASPATSAPAAPSRTEAPSKGAVP